MHVRELTAGDRHRLLIHLAQENGVVIADPIQKRRFMYGTMVDITDRKAADA